jgi:hypothetical protein
MAAVPKQAHLLTKPVCPIMTIGPKKVILMRQGFRGNKNGKYHYHIGKSEIFDYT